MTFTLLLADSFDPDAPARPVVLQMQVLQTPPGGEDVTVSFRPNRTDDLYLSAKSAAQLAYRVLFREGIVRSQLVLRLQLDEAPVNVVGRSADLPFALAMLSHAYQEYGSGGLLATGASRSVAATGVLESDGTIRAVDHLAAKLAAACSAFDGAPATIFFPADNAAEVELSTLSERHPNLQLRPIGHLDEALEDLGIVLERVYLRNPFRGLEYFDYEHRAIFFGRDAEIRKVVEQLLRREAYGAPGILVEGASGSGKSSFMRAGLLPALVNPSAQSPSAAEKLRRRPVRASVRDAIWRAGHLANAAGEQHLAQSILECWRALPELADRLPAACTSLMALADERAKHWPLTDRFVWLIDQLEELFALGVEDSAVNALGRFLLRLQAEGVWTLACIRADAVPQLKEHATLREVFGANEGEYYLETMSGTALDDVIGRPAEAAGLSFGLSPSGKRLDQVLREELYAMRENTLPLLQFTLQELYQRRSGTVLQYEAYQELGGLAGSVASAAEAAWQADPACVDALPRVFRGLIGVDDEGRPSKRYAPIAEIATGDTQRELLNRLVDVRLCITDQSDGSAVVSFAHEALLRTWPRLRDWLIRESALLQARDLLVAEARRWEQHNKQRDWLVTAPDRLASDARVIETDMPLPEIARQFAQQSARRATRVQRVRRLAVLSIAGLAIVAVAFGRAALKQRDAALLAQQSSLTQAASARLQNDDVATATAVILDAFGNRAQRRRYSADALGVLQEARAADRQLIAINTPDVVEVALFSPDGRHIASGSDDGVTHIWDAATGQPLLALRGHAKSVRSAAFSPDGRRIATASWDNTVRIWDTTNAQELSQISVSGPLTVGFSPDGQRVITGSRDRTARIWSSLNGQELLVLQGHTDNVVRAQYSSDGQRIVTASFDNTARVWDGANGKQLLVLNGHTDKVMSAMFSPDGRRIVTAAWDNTARIWDAATGAQLLVLIGHTNKLLGAAFSPDGRYVVTGSFDKTARIWDAATGRQLSVLSGHTNYVSAATFSPDGLRILTGSFDKTVRTWDAASARQLIAFRGHADRVTRAAFSPDGHSVVTASRDKSARIWDSTTGEQVRALDGHTNYVMSAAFSPDGRRIVTASLDKTVRMWDAASGRQLVILSSMPTFVFGAAFSPDGNRIVAILYDRTARILDAATGQQLLSLSGHTNSIEQASFSPDGRRVVTASDDGTARIWDAQTGRPLMVLRGHTAGVMGAEFSADGRRVVTASDDKTARLWDTESGQELLVFGGHTEGMGSASFSPDGSRIVTSDGSRIRIWDTSTGEQLTALTGHTMAVNTAVFSPDGKRVLSASDDRTARVWDAATAAQQVQDEYTEAAQLDPLSSTERLQFGLGRAFDVRQWPNGASKCEELTAAPYDPERRTPGVTQDLIVVDEADSACGPNAKDQDSARVLYQHGRVRIAATDFVQARRDLEDALAGGHRAAAVDLGALLSQPSDGMLDIRRAISLYERAWADGITFAAFKLGSLYERGVRAHDATDYLLPPAESNAWAWYQKGADAGEPNALARYGQKEEGAALSTTDSDRTAHLLRAFRYYASAAERARLEDWPDTAWRDWRYRRASIARALVRAGMMEEVAATYAEVCKQHTRWEAIREQVASLLGTGTSQ